jgi:hypothetical protein
MDDIFTTVIPLQYVTLSKFTEKWMNWLELHGDYASQFSSDRKFHELKT